ncbi:PilZ domain-containing protein [Sphingomonas yunnanensis]|uniref:PilZ domain-containing protein n=1 Tax=Sphingomonas yunnanensis TaxID=310400 RepID=UPI001CA706D4|nr:PilZ domain-containing protein [Sphingomonas yunnanensis]MBY9062064.1 PilZ domain-containing protein [Sphingomonas yunnanensis]
MEQVGAGGDDVWLEAASWSDNRRELRVPTALAGSLRLFLGESESVQVVDVSNRGCRLRGVALKAAQRVWLRIGELETLVGTVAWCDDGEAGIRFEQRLPRAVIVLLSGGAPDDGYEDI